MPTEVIVRLNDCKQCGSYAVEHVQKGIVGVFPDEFIVCCSTCTKKSDWKPTSFEAAQNWNEKNKPRG